MDVTGILKKVYDTQQVSDKFSKREFILTIDPNGQYPQHVSFQLTQDKTYILSDVNKFPEGQEVKVHFNLRGREWNGPQGIKYFNTLEAWRIEAIGDARQTTNEGAAAKSTVVNNNPDPEQTEGLGAKSDDNEDLPF